VRNLSPDDPDPTGDVYVGDLRSQKITMVSCASGTNGAKTSVSRHYASVLAELEDGDVRAIRAARQSVGRALDAPAAPH
jgi:hypothetical protein